MDKMSYVDFIEIYENEDTIELIGKIDTKFLKQNKSETLFYSFPLIERIVLEIYKLIPGADIEHLEQGRWRTVLPIVKNNMQFDILSPYIIELIEEYFADDGIRNKLFHIKEDDKLTEPDYERINFLIMKLVYALKETIKKYIDVEFVPIEEIK